jgi:glycosyltransferase involved in cell wall biosynthesis
MERLSGATVSVAPYPPIPFFYFCPLKAIECLGAGVPLVTTAQGDLPDIVGDAAVLVPPADARALAEAVACMLGDPVRREAIRRRAHQRARLFTWDAAARRICEIASGLRSRRRVQATGAPPP